MSRPLYITLVAFLAVAFQVQAQPKPLTNVHAHNDYEHKRPLFDALDHGFCSVEADVHLVDGQLLVAHSRLEVTPGKTLQALAWRAEGRRAEPFPEPI